MADDKTPKRSRLDEFKETPVTKATLLWSCLGSVVVALGIGFTVGGWVTGGTARDMVEAAGQDARFDLASAICVERFMAEPDLRERLTELREIGSTFRQRQYIEAGDWAIMPGRDAATRQAADLCARVLANLDIEEFETLQEADDADAEPGETLDEPDNADAEPDETMDGPDETMDEADDADAEQGENGQ